MGVRPDAKRYYGPLDYCEYVEIIRPNNSDSSYTLGRVRYVFSSATRIDKEFVMVRKAILFYYQGAELHPPMRK